MGKSRKQKSRRKNKELKPYTPVKLKLFQVPNPFEEIPIEQRRQHLKAVGAKAKEDVINTLPLLKKWFEEYDAAYILSFCTIYFLSQPEGIDKEVTGERQDFYHHYLELLQAFALTQKRSCSAKPLQNNAEQLQKIMQDLGESLLLREFDLPENITDAEFKKRRLLAELRGQTLAIRNWAYPDQIIRDTEKLFSRISSIIENEYSVEPSKLISALQLVAQDVEVKLNTHLAKVGSFMVEKTYQAVWQKYTEAFPDVKSNPEHSRRIFDLVGQDLRHMKWMLIAHSDLFLEYIFTFTLDEFAGFYGDSSKKYSLKAVLDVWAYEFGDLEKHNIDHFALDNPILKRPLIKLGHEIYFFPTIGIFGHMLPGLMEALVRKTNKEHLEKYQKARSKFLEDEAERLFKEAFSSAKVYRGSKWRDPDTDIEYENDLLVLLDSFAFVVESKSGFVDPPARRGAEYRLIDTLEDLVVNAATQANRFIQFLLKYPGTHDLPTASGRINSIDTTKIRHYVPLSITYESMGTVSANLRECIKAGLIQEAPDPLVPSICVSDLEIIFTLLENEVERIHYLIRRSQIERSLEYLADEMDLLAFYLDTGFNLGESEIDKQSAFYLLLKSKELDPYFTAKASGITVTKPRLDSTKWWRDIIRRIVLRKPQGWTEAGYVLLNVPKWDQVKLERELQKLLDKVRRGKVVERHNWVVLETTPKERSYFVAVYPYIAIEREERNQILNQILSSDRINSDSLGGVCIGVSATSPGYPYDVFAYLPGKAVREQAKTSL